MFAKEYIDIMAEGGGCQCDLANRIIFKNPKADFEGKLLPKDYEWDGLHLPNCYLGIAEETIKEL